MRNILITLLLTAVLGAGLGSCAALEDFFGEGTVFTTSDQLVEGQEGAIIPFDQLPAAVKAKIPEGTSLVMATKDQLKADAAYVSAGPMTGEDAGGLIDAGTYNLVTFEEMGFPNWVLDKGLCPGLPNWEALKDCSANFATPDSGGKGRWLEGPQTWHGDVMPNRLKGLGLDDKWTVKFAGAADALWAELKAAKKEGRGTVIFNWSPNFTDATGFTFIEFPPYFEGCRMKDGGSLKTTGCGSPKGWLKKGANYKFPKTHPKAYMAFSKLSFTAPHIGSMAALVDTDGMAHKDAGKKWLADNEDVWKPWTVSILGAIN